MVYKWYILPIGWLYATYHLLREPGNSIEKTPNKSVLFFSQKFQSHHFSSPPTSSVVLRDFSPVGHGTKRQGSHTRQNHLSFTRLWAKEVRESMVRIINGVLQPTKKNPIIIVYWRVKSPVCLLEGGRRWCNLGVFHENFSNWCPYGSVSKLGTPKAKIQEFPLFFFVWFRFRRSLWDITISWGKLSSPWSSLFFLNVGDLRSKWATQKTLLLSILAV